MPSTSNAGLYAVLGAVFLDVFGMGIIFPVLPYYAIDLGATSVQLGYMSGAYSLMQIPGMMLLGWLSDKIGRKMVLCMSLFGSAISFAGFGISETTTLLIFYRGLNGLLAGTMSISQAYIVDVTTQEDRPKWMGMNGAMMGLGMILGPAVGGAVNVAGGGGKSGFRLVAFFAGGLCALNLLIAMIGIQAKPATEGADAAGDALAEEPRKYSSKELLGIKGVLPYSLATFCQFLAFSVFEAIFAIAMKDMYGMGPSGMAAVFVTAGIFSIVVNVKFMKPMVDKFGNRNCVIGGHIARFITYTSLTAMSYPPLNAWWLPYILCFPAFIGGVFLSGCTGTALGNVAPKQQVGQVLGLKETMGAAGRLGGPFLGGYVYVWSARCPMLVGGVVSLVAIAVVFTAPSDGPKMIRPAEALLGQQPETATEKKMLVRRLSSRMSESHAEFTTAV